MVEYGEYLEEQGFECEYTGDAENYARYKRGNIEVWMYGGYVKMYESKDRARRCPTCRQRHDYVERMEIFENRAATLDNIKHVLSTLDYTLTGEDTHPIEDVATTNLAKLKSRSERDAIKGSGDNR